MTHGNVGRSCCHGTKQRPNDTNANGDRPTRKTSGNRGRQTLNRGGILQRSVTASREQGRQAALVKNTQKVRLQDDEWTKKTTRNCDLFGLWQNRHMARGQTTNVLFPRLRKQEKIQTQRPCTRARWQRETQSPVSSRCQTCSRIMHGLWHGNQRTHSYLH